MYLFEWGAQGYFLFIFALAAISVWNNRDTHALLMIEGPVRKKGVFASIGQGLRLSSARNSMGVFTMSLEFYQIWGLTWSASQMDTRYENQEELPTWYHNGTEGFLEGSFSGSGEFDNSTAYLTPDDSVSGMKDLLTYYCVIAMCVGWAILYSLPVVLTTTTVGNRRLAFELSEGYRKYLWFMSGAGFLTILKAIIKVQVRPHSPSRSTALPFVFLCVSFAAAPLPSQRTRDLLPACLPAQFCVPHPSVPDGQGPLVSMTHHSIECWGATHLRMVAIALLSLAIFFPAASLTTLFRYDDDDDRCPCKPVSCGVCGPEGKTGCVLGGEDIRWIHLWRRIEYLVKGMWVFTGYRLVRYGKATAVALFAGSFIIVWANSLMTPSNLRFVCRWKLLIHCCNCWTTTTCLWASYTDNTDVQRHFFILIPGWLLIWAVLGYHEYSLFRKDGFRKPAGDKQNIEKQSELVAELGQRILGRRGILAWGTHATIVDLIRLAEVGQPNGPSFLCTAFPRAPLAALLCGSVRITDDRSLQHPDIPVRTRALQEIVDLAYMDQMTQDRSFFMR
eukprot:SAG22_NODE_422_length_10687_cov_4.448149_3_plen_561_part_00